MQRLPDGFQQIVHVRRVDASGVAGDGADLGVHSRIDEACRRLIAGAGRGGVLPPRRRGHYRNAEYDSHRPRIYDPLVEPDTRTVRFVRCHQRP